MIFAYIYFLNKLPILPTNSFQTTTSSSQFPLPSPPSATMVSTQIQSVFDKLIIIPNAALVQSTYWLAEVQKIKPQYTPSTAWPDNKTIIFNYREADAMVIGLNVFFNQATIVVEPGQEHFVTSKVFTMLVDYLHATIKSLCPYDIANEIGFIFTVYSVHTMVSKTIYPMISFYTGVFYNTVLNEPLSTYMRRMEVAFKFDEQYNRVPFSRPGKPAGSNPPCFSNRVVPPPPPPFNTAFPFITRNTFTPFNNPFISNPNQFSFF